MDIPSTSNKHVQKVDPLPNVTECDVSADRLNEQDTDDDDLK